MEEKASESQTCIHETSGKKKREQQAPQVTRLYTKLVTALCSGEVKGDILRSIKYGCGKKKLLWQ